MRFLQLYRHRSAQLESCESSEDGYCEVSYLHQVLGKTEIMEIPHPSSLLAPNVLALINEKESVTSGDFDIEITKDVAIVKKDGKYYLMIACDDNGNPIADLSRVIRNGAVI